MNTVRRWARGLSGLVVVVLVLAGAPWLLSRVGRFDLLGSIEWRSLLTRSDGGAFLLIALTLVGWLAWIQIALTICAEIVAVASRQRIHWRVPGSRWTGPMAATLVGSIVALVGAGLVASRDSGPGWATAPGSASASASRPVSTERPSAGTRSGGDVATHLSAGDHRAPDRAPTPASGDAPHPDGDDHRATQRDAGDAIYVVQPDDDLWSLAEAVYGDPVRWRQIAASNGLAAESALYPGVVLHLPGTDQDTVNARTGQGDVDRSESLVTVRRGDSLWTLAERHLGAGTLWPGIAQANPTLILDPDRIEPGWVLHLPPRVVQGEHVVGPSSGSVDPSPQSDADEPDTDSSAGDAGRTAHPARGADGPTEDSEEREASVSPSLTGAGAEASAPPVPGRAAASSGPSSVPAAPTTAAPSRAAQPAGETSSTPGIEATPLLVGHSDSSAPDLRALLGGMAGLGAAGLVAALAMRRRLQMWARPAGRRVPVAPQQARAVRAALAALADDAVVPETSPGPTAVVVGESLADSRSVLLDLDDASVLVIRGEADLAAVSAAAICASLTCSEWSQSPRVRICATALTWLECLDEPGLEVTDPAAGPTELHRARLERAGLTGEPDGNEVFFLDAAELDGDELRLLREEIAAATDSSAPGLSVVCLDSRELLPDLGDTLTIRSDRSATLTGVDSPLRPNLLREPARRALVDLFTASTATTTEPAWWWGGDPTDPGADAASWNPEPDPTVIPLLPDRRRDDPSPAAPLVPPRRPDTSEVTVSRLPDALATSPHPVLLLLGPVELVGARGTLPTRAIKQCEEYCAWILAHPGRTSAEMTGSLLVADGTRRSNVSRLRTWLGAAPDGTDYLPEAYSGRITLHPGVTSDWEYARLLIAAGIDRAADEALVELLELVRGAPLADAAPGQWHWAEEMRIEMAGVIRDAGAELGRRAIAAGDLDIARWAVARALVAAPEDELLLGLRIRTEHQAGNHPEVQRLVLHLTRQARVLGVDLSEPTVTLLQEVMEGRARARVSSGGMS